MNETPINPNEPTAKDDSNSIKLSAGAWGAIGFSFVLIAFFAIPNFLHARHALQNQECVSRLTRLADCLMHLAEINNTQPGEKICELFDLNTVILADQRGSFVELAGEKVQTLYYQVGAEPDCPNLKGNHVYSLYLDENGEIVPPRCTLCDDYNDPDAEEQGWCVADMSKVDGVLSFEVEEESETQD